MGMRKESKIKPRAALARIAARLKRQGKRIVTTNGSFDLLHAGHALALAEAKRQGDVLMALVNSDASVRGYKGPTRPIIPERERLAMVSAIGAVDYATLFDELNPKTILAEIKPNVHCNASEWGKHCVERAVVEQHGGRIHVLKDRWDGMSTSAILKKVVATEAARPVRAIFLDRDGTINDDGEGYTHKREDFRFLPHVIHALQRLSKSDHKLIVVTNQSGIARGYYREAQMHHLHRWMRGELARQGVRIDRIYHCPHGPDDGCACRKPEPGMFLEAVKDFGVSLAHSWFVGDDPKDVLVGRAINLKTIKLGSRMPRAHKLEPHHYARHLGEAADIILKEG